MELHDIAQIFDCPHSTVPDEGAGYPLIRTPNVGKGRLILDNVHRVSKEIYDTRNRRAIPQPGDIIFAREAPAGNAAVITTGQWVCLGQRTVLIRPDSTKTDSVYLTYFLLSPQQQIKLLGLTHGSTVGHVNIPDLANLKLSLPPLPTQRRIAGILSAYDNLIENNNKRIRLLEQTAENLYKEWFVRFRFPGHEHIELAESKLGRIPSSFSVTNMNDVFADYIGGGWGNDDKTDEFPISASVIRGADFPNVWRYDTSTCPRRFHKTNNYKSRQLQDGDVIIEISGGTSEQPVGRSVLVTQDMINRFEDGKVICASFCKLVRLKKDKISPYFFYYWMNYLYDTRIIDRYQLQSTGIINFKFEAFLKKGIVMLPPKDLMLSFDQHIIPIFKEINQLAMQNDNLARQRDLLLPRLMSGKLEVNVNE